MVYLQWHVYCWGRTQCYIVFTLTLRLGQAEPSIRQARSSAVQQRGPAGASTLFDGARAASGWEKSPVVHANGKNIHRYGYGFMRNNLGRGGSERVVKDLGE